MSIKRNAWGVDERAEYDKLLAEVIAATNNTTARLDLFEAKLNDAIQAHRPWAREVEQYSVRIGLAKEIKAFQDRSRAMVAHNGRVLNLPKVQSTLVRNEESGEVFYQRELIELWTWEQIADKRTEALKARQGYTEKVAHYDRLLALRDMCPEANTPAEAAKMLGLNLDEFLGVEAKAS